MNMIRTPPKCNPGYHYSHQPPPGEESDRGWCYRCSPGTYTDERNRATQCNNCTVCSPDLGLVEEQPCRSSADRRCRCRDHHAPQHGLCQPIVVFRSPKTAIKDENRLFFAEITKTVQISVIVPPTVAPADLGEANSIYETLGTKSAKGSNSKTNERSVYPSDARWPLDGRVGRQVETTTEFGFESHTQIQSESVAFYFGGTPVTSAVMAMGIVSFVSLFTLAAVSVTLCIKRRKRKTGGKHQTAEVSESDDYHVYEDPETLTPALSSPLRIVVTAAMPEALGCASESLHRPSLPNASESSFAPLLGSHNSAGDEPPLYRCVEHADASHRVERHLFTPHIARPVPGANSSAAQVLCTNFRALETCGCAIGVVASNAAALDSKMAILTGDTRTSCVDLCASGEQRTEGRGCNQSECVCIVQAGAGTPEGLLDGGYIYSRDWE